MPVEITAAIIEGSFTLLATVIAAVCAALIGKQFQDRKKLKLQLDEAREDVAFLLAVEKLYGIRHKNNHGSSGKINVRECVRTTTDLNWSGNNTPGQIDYKRW